MSNTNIAQSKWSLEADAIQRRHSFGFAAELGRQWPVSPRLTLDLGAGFDVSSAPYSSYWGHPEHDFLTPLLFKAGGNVSLLEPMSVGVLARAGYGAMISDSGVERTSIIELCGKIFVQPKESLPLDVAWEVGVENTFGDTYFYQRFGVRYSF